MSLDAFACDVVDCEYCEEAPWTCCSCQRSYCMMDPPAHEFSVDYNCEDEGCMEPKYDPRVRDVVETFRGRGVCLCHPNVKRVLYGNSAGVHDCSCGSSHAICYDCMDDPISVTKKEIGLAKEKDPRLTTEQAVVKVYEEKCLAHKLQTLHIRPLCD